MARLDSGLVGFAPGALPGERLLVTASERKRGFVRATAYLLSQAAPERLNAPCPYAGACGGCDWLHVEYSAQLRYKLEILRDALSRVGHLDPLPELEIVAAPEPLRYRNRIRVHLAGSRIGFLGRGSHDLVDVASCAVASPELDRCLDRFRAIVQSAPALVNAFSEAELRLPPGAERGVVRLSPRSPEAPLSGRVSSALGQLAVEFEVVIAGTPSAVVQRFELAPGLPLELPAEAFVQVNWKVNLEIIAALVAEARARNVTRFVDLYAGAGNFTLPLLDAGCTGVAVEAAEAAARSAQQSIATRSFPATVLACDVLAGVRALIRDGQRFDLVVLDPPRSGARQILSMLPALGARHLAYCACDPVTLARDLKELKNLGFRLDSARVYDMFPGTHHFETVVWMTRVSAAPGAPFPSGGEDRRSTKSTKKTTAWSEGDAPSRWED